MIDTIKMPVKVGSATPSALHWGVVTATNQSGISGIPKSFLPTQWQVSASITSKQVAGTIDDIAVQFRRLANLWLNETGMYSSFMMMAANDNYLAIIAMGRQALPFILRELRDRGGAWYPALRAITKTNPVPREMAGHVARMKQAWLEWGRSEGLL